MSFTVISGSGPTPLAAGEAIINNETSPDFSSLTPVDGDKIMLVDETGDALQYVGTFDGYAVNAWLPYSFVERMTGFCYNDSSDKAILDSSSGDTIADYESAGWAQSGPATHTLTAGQYFEFAQNGSGGSSFQFNIATALDGKEMLLYAELDSVAARGDSQSGGTTVIISDGTREGRICGSVSATPDDYGVGSTSSSYKGVAAVTSVPAYTPTFLHLQPSQGAVMYALGQGRDMCQYKQLGTNSSPSVRYATRSLTGNTIRIKRMFALYVN